jgi:hypothetical protein
MNMLMAVGELGRFSQNLLIKAQLMVDPAPDPFAPAQAAIGTHNGPADRKLREMLAGKGACKVEMKPAGDRARRKRSPRLLPPRREDHDARGRHDPARRQIEDGCIGTGIQSVIVSVENKLFIFFDHAETGRAAKIVWVGSLYIAAHAQERMKRSDGRDER